MANSAAPTTNNMPGVTIRPVEPAPPVRTRPPRPEKRPEIKLSAAKEESRFVGPLPLAIGLIALVAILGFAHRLASETEDPHYVQAAESLSQYEMGKAETEKNYDSSIYADALASLAKVDPKSISGDKAAALVADIQFKTDAFHRRIRARDEAARALQAARDNRDAAYLAARNRDILMPQKKFPECNEGKDAHVH
jgi:hypothetical protein